MKCAFHCNLSFNRILEPLGTITIALVRQKNAVMAVLENVANPTMLTREMTQLLEWFACVDPLLTAGNQLLSSSSGRRDAAGWTHLSKIITYHSIRPTAADRRPRVAFLHLLCTLLLLLKATM